MQRLIGILMVLAALAASPALAQDICASNECGTRTPLVTIPDAENSIFDDDGRLFVTGGTNIFEITRDGPGYIALPLLDTACNGTGIEVERGWLYAVCANENAIYAGPILPGAQPVLKPIYTLTGVDLGNGTEFDGQGNLYVVDGPTSGLNGGNPRIIRLTFADGKRDEIVDQTDWLTTGLETPNGLARFGSFLFFTDGEVSAGQSAVKFVPILPDGAAGDVTTLWTTTSVLDGLSVVPGRGVLVSDFALGKVMFVGFDGSLLQETTPLTFASASSVRIVEGPLFDGPGLLVTEKGILQETQSPIGNEISLFAPSPE